MNKHNDTIEIIKSIITEKLNPTHLEVINESHLHEGHPGAKSGGGHFKLIISSPRLENKNRIQSHRMINNQLQDLFKDRIHALSILILDQC